MRYLSQLCIILGFTLAGEALQRLLPLPIPASVYGLVLLFLSLCAGIVKPEQIRQVSAFLISIMAVLFVSPAERGKELGRQLLDYGIRNLSVQEITVNEQNPQAVGFYEHKGFRTYKRTDHDEEGGPYPLLYMTL